MGKNIKESKLIKKFLKSCIHILAALKQDLDLKITSLEDIVGRLKVYDERIYDEDDQSELIVCYYGHILLSRKLCIR